MRLPTTSVKRDTALIQLIILARFEKAEQPTILRDVRFGSLADPHDTSKVAVRAAGIAGEADHAIHRKAAIRERQVLDYLPNDKRQLLAGTYL